METVREAKLKVCPGVLEMPPGVTVVCHADAFLALLAECQLMGEVAAGVDPSQQKHARAISNAHQESLEVNLGGDPAGQALDKQRSGTRVLLAWRGD